MDPTEGSRDRIDTLDVLRGLALLGMIIVHVVPWLPRDADGATLTTVVDLAIRNKSRGTFAFLFGAGFALILSGCRRAGRAPEAVLARRFGALAVLGVAVEVFFGYHMLVEFAIWGGLAMALHRLSDRVLLGVALVAVTLTPARSLVAGVRTGDAARVTVAAGAEAGTLEWEAPRTIAPAGTPAERAFGVEARRSLFRSRTYAPRIEFALFVLGILAIRRRIFAPPREHRRLIVGAMAAGSISWILAHALRPPRISVPVADADAALRAGLGLVDDQWLTLTYIGAVALWLAARPSGGVVRPWIGAAGRVALTNYVVHAALLSSIVRHTRLAHGAGPIAVLAFAFALFAILAIGSRLWLRRFGQGPLERLWRAATYGRWRMVPRPAIPAGP